MTNYIDLTIGHFAGLEYKPFKQQNFKVFGYYYDNSLHFKGDIASANNSRQYSLFALGFLLFHQYFQVMAKVVRFGMSVEKEML